MSNFECWRKRRNETFNLEPERQVPDSLLLGHDSAAICKWLSVYVAEARKQDGSPFPPKSLYMLLTGLLRHMRSKNPTCPNFLETNQLEFVSLHNAMDNVFRKLRVEGVQAESRSTGGGGGVNCSPMLFVYIKKVFFHHTPHGRFQLHH